MKKILILFLLPVLAFATYISDPWIITDITSTAVDYAMDGSETFVGLNTTDSSLIITLPPISDMPIGVIKQFQFGHASGTNGVRLECDGTDEFIYGNTYFELGPNMFRFTVAILRNGGNAWGLVRNLTIRCSAHRDTNWSASNFSSMTIIPWDSEDYNNQAELLHYQEASSGSITAFADAGDGQVTVTDAGHGIVNGDHITISGTTYDGDYTISNVTTDTFEITATWTATDTGTWASFTRVWIGTTGTYKVNYTIAIDSTGGSTWQAVSYVYKNGIEVTETQARNTNYGNEDGNLILSSTYIDLVAGDYVDLRIDQNNLTGNLVHSMFNLELRL